MRPRRRPCCPYGNWLDAHTLALREPQGEFGLQSWDSRQLATSPGLGAFDILTGVTTAAEPRVLLVDDDTRLLVALRRALSLKGFEVETAKDAGEALHYIEQRWGDVIVLDVMMPVVDGLSLCRLIRDRVQSPILML